MRAVVIKCPNCGADVQAGADSETATCAYCGTTAYVQRRSRMLQIPRAIPPQRQQMPVARVRQTFTAIGCFAVMAIVATVGTGVFMAVNRARRAVHSATSSLRTPTWDGVGATILTDINGDGTADAIGRLRVIQGETMYLGAFDGATGKRLWLTETLGARGDMINTPSGLTGGVVVIGAGPGEVVGVSASDGSIKWKIRLSEKIKAICAGASTDTVVVETADKRRQVVALADGAVQGVVDGPCTPLPTDSSRASSADREIYSWAGDNSELAPSRLEGIDAREAVHDPHSGVTIAVGNKKPGTRVGMVAAYHPGDNTPLWTALVPAGDPLKAYEGAPELEHVDVDGDAVAVAYKMEFQGKFRVTLFGAADGKRRWDSAVPSKLPLAAVRLAPKHVFVSCWGALLVYDRATGRLLHTLH